MKTTFTIALLSAAMLAGVWPGTPLPSAAQQVDAHTTMGELANDIQQIAETPELLPRDHELRVMSELAGLIEQHLFAYMEERGIGPEEMFSDSANAGRIVQDIARTSVQQLEQDGTFQSSELLAQYLGHVISRKYSPEVGTPLPGSDKMKTDKDAGVDSLPLDIDQLVVQEMDMGQLHAVINGFQPMADVDSVEEPVDPLDTLDAELADLADEILRPEAVEPVVDERDALDTELAALTEDVPEKDPAVLDSVVNDLEALDADLAALSGEPVPVVEEDTLADLDAELPVLADDFGDVDALDLLDAELAEMEIEAPAAPAPRRISIGPFRLPTLEQQ